MNLRLQYPPTPEHMHEHAAVAARSAADIDRVVLDYGVASLEEVDRILGGFHDEGIGSEQVAETLFAFGAYMGEVMVRRAGGVWVIQPAGHPLSGWPVIELPSGSLVNPIGKAFKRVDLGETENLPYFYQVLVAHP
jgi:Family of unknown function (DUF6278)